MWIYIDIRARDIDVIVAEVKIGGGIDTKMVGIKLSFNRFVCQIYQCNSTAIGLLRGFAYCFTTVATSRAEGVINPSLYHVLPIVTGTIIVIVLH